jgi:hypothetical protein
VFNTQRCLIGKKENPQRRSCSLPRAIPDDGSFRRDGRNRRAIGSFSYEKRLKSGRVIVCEVKVFGLQVKQQEEHWSEKGERKVKWLSRTRAAKTVRDRGLGAIIRALPKRH